MITELKLPEGTIIKMVECIDRTTTPEQALDATGCRINTKPEALNSIMKGVETNVKVYLIPFREILSIQEIEERLAHLGRKIVDFSTHCALNEQDHDLAKSTPNISFWRDSNGQVYYLYFEFDDLWCSERRAFVSDLKTNISASLFVVCF